VAPPGMREHIPVACCCGVSVIDGHLGGRAHSEPSNGCL